MIHPKIDLPALTAELESIGFEARTKLLFRRGFVDVLIVNGLVPDQTPEDLVEKFASHFRITVFADGGDIQGSFDCPIDGLTVLSFNE